MVQSARRAEPPVPIGAFFVLAIGAFRRRRIGGDCGLRSTFASRATGKSEA